MTLKQRHTPFDRILLRVVFPAVCDSPFRPLLGAARFWTVTSKPSPVTRPEAAPDLALVAAQAPLTAHAA